MKSFKRFQEARPMIGNFGLNVTGKPMTKIQLLKAMKIFKKTHEDAIVDGFGLAATDTALHEFESLGISYTDRDLRRRIMAYTREKRPMTFRNPWGLPVINCQGCQHCQE